MLVDGAVKESGAVVSKFEMHGKISSGYGVQLPAVRQQWRTSWKGAEYSDIHFDALIGQRLRGVRQRLQMDHSEEILFVNRKKIGHLRSCE